MGKAGRPKGENNKEIICSMRMDEAMMRWLSLYCEKTGMKKSEAIRRALELLASEEGTD